MGKSLSQLEATQAVAVALQRQITDLEQQRDAALKLADKWIEQQAMYHIENEICTHPKTIGEVEVAQAAVKACARELRAIFEPKEGK